MLYILLINENTISKNNINIDIQYSLNKWYYISKFIDINNINDKNSIILFFLCNTDIPIVKRFNNKNNNNNC